MKITIWFLLAALLAANVASAAALTNADIAKMSAAKLDDSIILTSIENSETAFDTSAQGLIELSEAKVSQPVIQALIKRGSGPAHPAAAPKTAAPVAAGTAAASDAGTASDTMLPSEILMVDGDQTKPMRYLNPQMRSAARGLGFGGIASYAVLRGVKANERTKNPQPTFVVAVPNQAQAESYMTVASFAVRSNNSREVMIGGGFMSYSSGIHPDRVMATNSEKAADQSRAPKGFTIYRVTPKSPLAAGEYAVILYTGEMQSMIGTWFTGTGNSYFDFGVDR